MAIDPRYFMSPSLQQYLVEKTTGFPLAAGEVYFFEDNDRSQQKSVYKLSGSPPNYSFVAIGNKITLSSVGTMMDDLGNDFIPYLLPEDDQGNLQLYYVEVYSAGGPTSGVLQFTRQAWPPEASGSSSNNGQESDLNLIPNGQFALHNNIAANIVTGDPVGRITAPITDIAPGGWTFERPSTSLSTDTVTFTRLAAFTDNPTGSPRYEVLIQSNGGSPADAFKDLRKKWNDVNKFASDTQQYTVFFSARSTTGNSFTVSLNLIKNYGTGGDPEEVINIDDFTVTPTQQDFSVSFVWGSNVGKTIGLNNDDFCQLAFSLPTNITFGAAMTDFVDRIGEINIVEFPITTDEDFVDRSLVPPIPGFNAETFGLPIISTAKGLDYDYSYVGIMSPTSSYLIGRGWVEANGATIRTDSFYPDGVPCSRLRNAYLPNVSPNSGVPIYGTGSSYVTSYRISAPNPPFIIAANSAGISAPVSDGAVPTGFTFLRVATGVANDDVYHLTSQICEDTVSFWVESKVAGPAASSFSSSGSNINVYGNFNAPTNNTPYVLEDVGERYGTTKVKNLIIPSSSGTPGAGTYFCVRTFSTINNVVFWFNVNGGGAQPVVPGTNTYVRINLTTLFGNPIDVSYTLSRAINGAEIGYVQPIPGSSIAPNSYFNFFVGTQRYYVWYSLNNAGNDPNISGAIGIKVAYTAADSIATVSLNSINAINRMYYALPDLRGWVIKGFDPSSLAERDLSFRFRSNGNRRDPETGFVAPGSYQYEKRLGAPVSTSTAAGPPITPQNIYPNYPIPPTFGLQTKGPGFDITAPDFAYSNYAGPGQADVKNFFAKYMIKY